MIKSHFIFLVMLLTSCGVGDINDQPDTTKHKAIDSIGLSNLVCDTLLNVAQIEFTDSILSFSIGTFPESWDTNHTLRSSGEKVLIWKYSKNDLGREWKSCIVINQIADSVGRIEYCISDKYSYERPFQQWYYARIHHGPDSSSNFGFSDLLLECYDHRPTKNEIDVLLDRFMFEFTSENYVTLEAGIDVELWTSAFGYRPSNVLTRQK